VCQHVWGLQNVLQFTAWSQPVAQPWAKSLACYYSIQKCVLTLLAIPGFESLLRLRSRPRPLNAGYEGSEVRRQAGHCPFRGWFWPKSALSAFENWGLTLYSPVVIICTSSFNTQTFYVLSMQCIYVFCVDLRTNSDYLIIQDWLVFITETEYVYCAVRATALNINQVNGPHQVPPTALRSPRVCPLKRSTSLGSL
jgi:hypothetical protein